MSRDAALRRFATVWVASLALKLLALGLFVVLAAKLLGGF